MYDLEQFSLSEMTACGAAVRKLGRDTTAMEGAASQIARYFYENFVDPQTGESAFALARFFKTHDFSELSDDLQAIAQDFLGHPPDNPQMKCLTLLGTAGDRPEWNERRQSTGHQVIPLPSERTVTSIPMISQLIQQLGLSVSNVVAPVPDVLVDLQERTFNVFHIPEAADSPYIPAQTEFVQPFQIKSVLGFGGILPSGNLMVIILFSKIPISRATAELFKPLALNVKMAVLPFDRGTIFMPIAS
ncbi:hypothetical protein [Leptolyngbya iicbica]|uniref:Uncharacterized protein n=2 Tax=Cyanophyceae TaxID=3028117 RepID=A0A4Q7E3F5_9CYAN|nr:hypothetical protein [Leptolyngbya sp. LK]RZM75999.1 hypothetical protein DYY88_19065 [Leptolyngbya sp. LK]